MKKTTLFVAVIAAMMAFTSCGKKEACYQVDVKTIMTVAGQNMETKTSTYVYGTKDDVDAAVEQIKKTSISMPGAQVKYDVATQKVDKAKADCAGASIKM